MFKFDGVMVARAVVFKIVAPGQSKCDQTGRFNTTHNVFWLPESFVDLRGKPEPVALFG